MEWSEFARRLGRELAGLERDTILIVRERDESRHYVQAMREPDRLYAEAVSNNFLDGPLLLTLADEEVMSEAGWRPPADPAPRNWWTELPGLASGAEYGRLAEVMVTALRDVQGVRRPADLVYESFHRHGTGLIELLDFGLDIADATRITRSRGTPPVALDGPVPAEAPLPASPAPASLPAAPAAPAVPDELEPRLADAKQRGDHTTYFELLLTAELVLPAVADAAMPTITIGSGTYITVFTSPQALARVRPGASVPTTFARLRAGWPDPSWQLAVNPGLPSEVHLDMAAVTRLEAQQRESGLRALAAGAPPSPNGHHAGDPTVTTAFAPFDTPLAASMNGHDTPSGPLPASDPPLPPAQAAEPVPPPPVQDAEPAGPPVGPAVPPPPAESVAPPPIRDAEPAAPPSMGPGVPPPPAPTAEPAGPPPMQSADPAALPPVNPVGPPPAHDAEPAAPSPMQSVDPTALPPLNPASPPPVRDAEPAGPPPMQAADPAALPPTIPAGPPPVQDGEPAGPPLQGADPSALPPMDPAGPLTGPTAPPVQATDPIAPPPAQAADPAGFPSVQTPDSAALPPADPVGPPPLQDAERIAPPPADPVGPPPVQPAEPIASPPVSPAGPPPPQAGPPAAGPVPPYGDLPVAGSPRGVEAPDRPPLRPAGPSVPHADAPEPSEAPAEQRAEAVPALPLAAPVDATPEPGSPPPVQAPHGARLWQWDDGEETLVAVYDAVGGAWTPVRADAVPGPRTD
ncbi:SseB family protein [Spirillospora sp. NPDC127200]